MVLLSAVQVSLANDLLLAQEVHHQNDLLLLENEEDYMLPLDLAFKSINDDDIGGDFAFGPQEQDCDRKNEDNSVSIGKEEDDIDDKSYEPIIRRGKRKRSNPNWTAVTSHNELEGRQEMRFKSTGKDKLDLLIKIHETSKDDQRPLSKAAQDFKYVTLMPIMNCLHNHFAGNASKFLETYGSNFRPSLFGKQCCTGKDKLMGCSIVTDNNPTGSSDDLSERHQLYGIKDNRTKILKMQEMHKSLDKRFSKLTRAAQNFIYLYLNPIMQCLNKHHGGNVDSFLEMLGDRELQTTTFKESICYGGNGKKCHLQPSKKLNDLPARHQLRTTYNPRDRINLLRSIQASCGGCTSGLTSAAKAFVFQQMNPVLDCLQTHFNGNVNAFLRKHGDFQHSRFQRFHCCGKGSQCNGLISTQ